MKKTVYVKENEQGKKFYYIKLGAKDHFRPIDKLWVPKKVVKECEKSGESYVQFPIQGVTIQKGRKDLILKPGRFNLFYYFVWSGDRGKADVEIETEDAVLSYAYDRYESPRASLGISKEILVLTPSNCITIGWSRTGFVQDRPKKGVTKICFDPDYNKKELKVVEDAEVETVEEIDLDGFKRLKSLLGLENTTKYCKIYE